MKSLSIQNCLNLRQNNFTLMRLLAAFAVLYGHSYVLSGGLKIGEDPISNMLIPRWGESLPSISVDMFFVISGFLICASYVQRRNFWVFVEARLLRILPGLTVALIFCILIGACVTSEPVVAYFKSPATVGYLKTNMFLVGGIQFELPGVFTANPFPGSVNGSLWTLPIEVRMYFWVAVLGALSLLWRAYVFNALFLLTCLVYAQAPAGTFFMAADPRHAHLGLLFLLGTFFYVNRRRISLGFAGLLGLAVLTYITRNYSFSLFIKSVFFAYLVLLVAIHPKLNLPSIDRWGDISFGLYIYAFPVQQTLAYMMPPLRPYQMLILSSVITISLAIVSWKVVEQPALKLKGKLALPKKAASALS